MADAAVERQKKPFGDSLSSQAFAGIGADVMLGAWFSDKAGFAAFPKPCGDAFLPLIKMIPPIATPRLSRPVVPDLVQKLPTINFVANSIPGNVVDGFAKGEIPQPRMMAIPLPASRGAAALAGDGAAKRGNAPDACALRQAFYGKNEAEAPKKILEGSVDGDGQNICA